MSLLLILQHKAGNCADEKYIHPPNIIGGSVFEEIFSAILYDMKHEGHPEENESRENLEQLYEQEIRKALSPTWAKSTQELLPGYLPNKSPGEYSHEELDQYRIAYAILGKMTQDGELEVSFEEESVEPAPDSPVENETIAIPRFKLVTNGGKKSENHNISWQGGLVLDQ